jgi:hypothetical protein
MTLVTFHRTADDPPPLREILRVEPDGTFRMWRSNAEAVGRFAGTVPGFEALAAQVGAARAAEPPAAGRQPADATLDTIEVDGFEVTLRPSQRPDGPWGGLAARLRDLLKELLAQPEAAIALDIGAAGGFERVRLVQRGSSALPIKLGSLDVTLEVFRDTTTVATGHGSPIAARDVAAGPGWSEEVAVPALEVPAGTVLLVRASFVAVDDGVLVPVTVEAVIQG